MQRTNRSGDGGEKSLLCDPGSELRLAWRETIKAKIINGMEKKGEKKKRVRIVGWQSSSFRHYPSSYSHRHYRCCLLQSFSDLSLFIPWWMRRSSCVHACDNTACWTYGGRGHTVHLCIMHQGETASASATRQRSTRASDCTLLYVRRFLEMLWA